MILATIFSTLAFAGSHDFAIDVEDEFTIVQAPGGVLQEAEGSLQHSLSLTQDMVDDIQAATGPVTIEWDWRYYLRSGSAAGCAAGVGSTTTLNVQKNGSPTVSLKYEESLDFEFPLNSGGGTVVDDHGPVVFTLTSTQIANRVAGDQMFISVVGDGWVEGTCSAASNFLHLKAPELKF